MQPGWDNILYLENGHVFEGKGFGACETKGGEAVFNTGMSGYQEVFTDPSYLKQIVVMTYPHLGNTGINNEDLESKSLYLSGVVAREYCHYPSNYRSKETLHDYLAGHQIPAISEVDTRYIVSILRNEGAQRSVIFPKKEIPKNETAKECGNRLLKTVPQMDGLELVSEVSTKENYVFGEVDSHKKNIIVYDYGVKTNILRCFSNLGFNIEVVPYQFPYQEVLKRAPTAVVLSNGPGDPSTVQGATTEIEGLIGKVPIFAICMGHQLLARTLGAKTYKLKFGHHGVNHPVQDHLLGKIMITSQNHGFAVDEKDLKIKDIMLSHVSLNDHSVEGFYSKQMRLLSVQFHPESKPGPSDSSLLFDYFLRGVIK